MKAPSQPPAVPYSWQARAVERELDHQSRVLPDMMQRGHIKPERAAIILRDLRAAVTTLRALAAADPLATLDGRRPPEPPRHYTDTDAAA